MALISPNARHFVKVTRNILVDGKGRVAGDVVDVNQATKDKLVSMGLAVVHTSAVEDVHQAIEKAIGKAKGK